MKEKWKEKREREGRKIKGLRGKGIAWEGGDLQYCGMQYPLTSTCDHSQEPRIIASCFKALQNQLTGYLHQLAGCQNRATKNKKNNPREDKNFKLLSFQFYGTNPVPVAGVRTVVQM